MNCIQELNVPMDHRCIEFLDRYWAGIDVTSTKEDSYYYNDLCNKQLKEMFIAVFTAKLSIQCHERYFKMLCTNCSSQHVLGVKHGKGLRNFLETVGPKSYFPIFLTFASFILGEKNPVFINYQIDKQSKIPYIIAAWNEIDLIQSDIRNANNYFTWWKKKAKVFNIYRLLTVEEIKSEHSQIIKLSGLNQLTYYVKKLLEKLTNSYYSENKHRINLIQSILLGYIIRASTRKTNEVFGLQYVNTFVNDFVEYTGNLQAKESLKNLLITVSRSKVIKQLMN